MQSATIPPISKNRYHFNPIIVVLALIFGSVGYFTYHFFQPLPQNLLKSEEKTTGKNGKHANPDAKNKAEEAYQKVKEAFETLNKKPKKTKADNKLLEKLKKQVEHWRKKKDWNGENHSQKSKGN